MRSIVIIDFGSQYTQLLARAIRALGVYCEVLSHKVTQEDLLKTRPLGIILSGGPLSVTSKGAPQLPSWLFELSVPLLGICYGMQAMAQSLGGKVAGTGVGEYGQADIECQSSRLFQNLTQKNLSVWMSHGDHVVALPPQFKVTAKTVDAPVAAMEHETQPWYALQFHPEVTHTTEGKTFLSTFVFDICEAKVNWDSTCILTMLLDEVKTKVKQDTVLLGISGGVDSSVVAALLHRAIGPQLQSVFIDTGLLRLDEVEEARHIFVEGLGLSVEFVDAKARFLKALKGVTCPEEKRKIIGHTFIEVFDEIAIKKKVKWLAQGTIYSDVIESAKANLDATAHVIKSHHNVGGLPKTMRLKLLEPIRTLFKDEVRLLGGHLGLPKALLQRHPFPGAGLAVRVLGEILPEYLEIVRQADAIFMQSLKESGLYDKVSQAFAVFIPEKSVGVVGDARAYAYVIALRAVETQDFMTATFAKLPWDFLDEVARKIINRVKGISRVTYDISGKPPATIEWE